MSADKIEIRDATFDWDEDSESEATLVRLRFCEWRRNGEFGSAYHDKIPDDVRIALALLVAPGLVEPKSGGA
jgi:hypothetical protein